MYFQFKNKGSRPATTVGVDQLCPQIITAITDKQVMQGVNSPYSEEIGHVDPQQSTDDQGCTWEWGRCNSNEFLVLQSCCYIHSGSKSVSVGSHTQPGYNYRA